MTRLLPADHPQYDQLWALLIQTAKAFTQGDSQSLPYETMEALLTSICYTLRRSGLAPQDFARAQALLREEVEVQKACWQRLRTALPDLDSESLHTTVEAMGIFYKHYEPCFLAHEIPCLIDYPLLIPVPEDVLGIDFIALYQRRLREESRLLSAFPPKHIRPLLSRQCASWQQVPFNLCQPVLANALGLMALGLPYQALRLDACQVEALRGLSSLEDEAKRLCEALSLDEGYFVQAAADLLPRIRIGGHGGVFTAL